MYGPDATTSCRRDMGVGAIHVNLNLCSVKLRLLQGITVTGNYRASEGSWKGLRDSVTPGPGIPPLKRARIPAPFPFKCANYRYQEKSKSQPMQAAPEPAPCPPPRPSPSRRLGPARGLGVGRAFGLVLGRQSAERGNCGPNAKTRAPARGDDTGGANRGAPPPAPCSGRGLIGRRCAAVRPC